MGDSNSNRHTGRSRVDDPRLILSGMTFAHICYAIDYLCWLTCECCLWIIASRRGGLRVKIPKYHRPSRVSLAEQQLADARDDDDDVTDTWVQSLQDTGMDGTDDPVDPGIVAKAQGWVKDGN